MIDNQVIRQIAAIDDAFEPLISKFPNYPLIKSEIPINSPFVSLVETVISQQLSGKAAQTITNRLREKIELSPKEISAADTNLLRSVGLSGAKAKTIQELAGAVLAGLDLDELSNRSAIEIRSQLIAIWGIGNWTVDMFLMFDL
ncbi:MAG: DNA-3-methyladenine glycosylase family protein, partial [Candidatus Nanopelagicales bacterium]